MIQQPYKLSLILITQLIKTSPGATGPTGPTGAGVTGPTGATGSNSFVGATGFNPGSAPGYVPGQVVIFDGSSYVVNVPNPQGTPGSSPDYTLISAAGATGPTGASGTGATGPTGPGALGAPFINVQRRGPAQQTLTNINDRVIFDTTVAVGGGATLSPDGTTVQMNQAGVYVAMLFLVGGNQLNVGLYQNATTVLLYGSDPSFLPSVGFQMLTLAATDTISVGTVANFSDTLTNQVQGSLTYQASLIVFRIG